MTSSTSEQQANETDFEIAEDFFSRAVLAAVSRLQGAGDLGAQTLGDMQKVLRAEARGWHPGTAKLPPGVDLRSSVGDKRKDLLEQVGAVRTQDRTSWAVAQAWSVAEAAVVQYLKAEKREKEAPKLKSYLAARSAAAYRDVRANASRIRSTTNAVQRALRASAQALEQSMPHVTSDVKHDLQRAIGLFRKPETLHRLVSPLYLAPTMTEAEEQSFDIDGMWSLVCIMRLLCAEVFGLTALCDCYIQLPSKDLLVVASSDQNFPGPPPRPFASRVVPSQHLLGGAAVATNSIIANDDPDIYTNTNHQQEGEPELTLAVPTVWPPDHRSEVFVSLFEPPEKSWNELQPAFISLAALARLVPAIGNGSERFEWVAALEGAAPFTEFEERLREITKPEETDADRLGILVISAPADEAVETQPESVRRVLDAWAKSTALSKARGDRVYRLDYEGVSAYGIVRSDLSDSEWQRWRDGRELKMIEAFRPDGKRAGWLAGWVVPWRRDVRMAAAQAMEEDDLFAVISDQVRISALKVEALNEIRLHVSRGNYSTAYALAVDLVLKCGRSCGVAVGYLVRMAIQIGHFRKGLMYSGFRQDDARWDVEGPLNSLLGQVALGDLDLASKHLAACGAWLEGKDSVGAESTLVRPMVLFACSIVQWLSDASSRPNARATLTAAAQQIGRSSGYASHLENCLTAIGRWQREPTLTTYNNADEDIEAALDAMLSAPRNELGELEYWWELESLRRLVMVLRGYLAHQTPKDGLEEQGQTPTVGTSR